MLRHWLYELHLHNTATRYIRKKKKNYTCKETTEYTDNTKLVGEGIQA